MGLHSQDDHSEENQMLREVARAKDLMVVQVHRFLQLRGVRVVWQRLYGILPVSLFAMPSSDESVRSNANDLLPFPIGPEKLPSVEAAGRRAWPA